MPPETEDVTPDTTLIGNLDRALFFGKRRKGQVGTRVSGRNKKQKKLDELSIECVKERLFDIQDRYMTAISHFGRSWTSEKRRELLFQKLTQFNTEDQIASVVLSFEEGFSWPISPQE